MPDDLIRLSKKNASPKNKMLETSNENDAVPKCNDLWNEKIKGLELDNKMLQVRIASFKCKQSISYGHEKSHVNELMKENEVLKKKSNELNEIMLKFTSDQKNLEKLLITKKCVFDKGGLRYKCHLKQKNYKNYFVKPIFTSDNKIVCHYCNQHGHMKYRCPMKINAYYGVTCVWVPKGTITNNQGLKKVWVPKI